MKTYAFAAILFLSASGDAMDLGFRYDPVAKKCLNFQKAEGLNTASFDHCTLTGAIFDQHTQLPFPKDSALQMGMTYQESPEKIVPSMDAILTPPEMPSIVDARIFQTKISCGQDATSVEAATEDCRQKVSADLTVRKPLNSQGETPWKLVFMNNQGSLWQNSYIDLMIWRSAENISQNVSLGKQICADLQNIPLLKNAGLRATLPEIDDFSEIATQWFRSLFPEVQNNSYWSSTCRDKGTGLYYFFEGSTGLTSAYNFADQSGTILCKVGQN